MDLIEHKRRAIESGKRQMTEGMEQPNHEKFRTHQEKKETYKFIGHHQTS